MSLAVFFILGLIAVAAAIMVVNTKSPVAAALYLVLVMCALAGLFALLGAVFLAALQVIVYAGAIMVLFLFVIMLLNLRRDEFGRDPRVIQKYLGFALVLVILVQGIFMISWAMKDYALDAKSLAGTTPFSPTADSTGLGGYTGPYSVAETLFTRFAYPFEVTSILLLAAIIGAVVIARRRPAEAQEREAP